MGATSKQVESKEGAAAPPPPIPKGALQLIMCSGANLSSNNWSDYKKKRWWNNVQAHRGWRDARRLKDDTFGWPRSKHTPTKWLLEIRQSWPTSVHTKVETSGGGTRKSPLNAEKPYSSCPRLLTLCPIRRLLGPLLQRKHTFTLAKCVDFLLYIILSEIYYTSYVCLKYVSPYAPTT